MRYHKIFILGAGGFVGSAVRRQLKTVGYDIEVFQGDINDRSALDQALSTFKADAIIHLVGIVKEKPPQVTFQKIHVSGTRTVLEAAKALGVKKIIYVSALGASVVGSTAYFRTKAEAENLIKHAGITFTIFRPSLMFGKGAGFTNQLVAQMQRLPFIPIVGKGEAKFQLVAVDVTAECITQALVSDVTDNKTYDLVGPEALSLEEITQRLAQSARIKKPIVHIPVSLIKFVASLEKLGLPTPITHDQLRMITEDSVGDAAAMSRDFNPPMIKFDPQADYPLY